MKLHFIEPRKPGQNALIERFNGHFRDKCLNHDGFISLPDAQQKVEAWKQDYNRVRLHSSVGNQTPEGLTARGGALRSPAAPFAPAPREKQRQKQQEEGPTTIPMSSSKAVDRCSAFDGFGPSNKASLSESCIHRCGPIVAWDGDLRSEGLTDE